MTYLCFFFLFDNLQYCLLGSILILRWPTSFIFTKNCLWNHCAVMPLGMLFLQFTEHDIFRSNISFVLYCLGFGFFLSALSLFVAGGMEIIRKQELAASGGIVQELGNQKFNSSTLSMMLLVPQFGIFGISEIFAAVSGRFYREKEGDLTQSYDKTPYTNRKLEPKDNTQTPPKTSITQRFKSV